MSQARECNQIKEIHLKELSQLKKMVVLFYLGKIAAIMKVERILAEENLLTDLLSASPTS